jgi:hypothetical protein
MRSRQRMFNPAFPMTTPPRDPVTLFAARGSRRGFALLITITLLAFLVLLLVSLASLTRVETRVADNNQKQAQARANALFALNTALGQLQVFAGPDQRVTGAADLGDGSSNSLPVPATGARRWTGVWGNANAPDADRSSPVFLNWLVSGNEATEVKANADGSISTPEAAPLKKPDAAVANLANATALSTDLTLGGQPARLLVGPGTVGTSGAGGLGEAGYVAAPLVSLDVTADLIPGQTGGNATPVGRYAWWVGDEGTKARANLVESEEAISATADADKRMRYRVAGRAGVEVLSGAPVALSGADMEAANTASLRAELSRVFDHRQLGLPASGAAFPATFIQQHYHDLSTVSRGVLANTLAGGLRKDLTAAFAEGTTKAEAPTGPVWQLGTTDELKGPDWQLLRSYYQLPFSTGASGTGNNLSLTPRPQIDGTTDAGKPGQHGIFPVVAHWQCYVEGRVTPLVTGNCGLEMRYYPAIVLWNPYNVTLKDHTYRVTYAINGGNITFMRVSKRVYGSGGAESSYTKVPPAISPEAQLETPWVNGMQIAVQSGDMEPGVAYVYTLKNNVYYSTDTFTPYTLTRGWNSGGTRAVIIGGNSFSLPGADNSKYMVSLWCGTNNSGANTIPSWASSTTAVSSTPNPSPTATEPTIRDDNLTLATDTGEPLQFISGNNNYENAFKLRFAYNEFLYQDLRAVVGFYGHRWALKGSVPGSWGTGGSARKNNAVRWLADYNPRAPYSTRSAFETQGNDVGYGYFQTNPNYNFNLIAAAQHGAGALNLVNINATISCDPDTGRAFTGMSQTSWDGAGESRVVLFNVPRKEQPLVSLGELQHAQTYRVNGIPFLANTSPAYAFGNSLADPRGSLDAPSKPWSEIAIGSSSYSTYKATARTFDHSYLLNRAIWDGYYFSTVPRTGAATFPLANARLAAHPREGATPADELIDYRKSAADLLVNGAFNINSVSAQAWRALLAGLNNVPVGGTRKTKSSPYPRSGYPVDDSLVLDTTSTTDAGQKAAAYEGYRFLTEAQIDALADQIVVQVRRRGPFVSVADFVNRALTAGSVSGVDNRLKGALAQAIEDAGINNAFAGSEQAVMPAKSGSGYTSMVENAADGATATNVPGWLTQADLLQPLGPVISARSDTFTIRAYGEALNPVLASADAGYIQGRAWCEAVVQRVPDYVSTANQPWETGAALSTENQTFGRRFKVVSFRWLSPDDI